MVCVVLCQRLIFGLAVVDEATSPDVLQYSRDS